MTKRFSLFIIIFFILSTKFLLTQSISHDKTVGESSAAIIQPARQVIKRVIGERANSINLQVIPAKNGRDTYQIIARNGKLTIRGSSTVAITYGFNQYLQKACHSMVTWSGKHLNIPSQWPDYETERISSPYKYRYYLNVVTFGYSTVFWGWPRWQKELDWMAIHGINMPMALVGTEAIKARVWKKLGISDSVITRYFTGPAYLPWNRMGNIVRWDGPLPTDWIQSQISLQHKILDRMRELGMSPIAPAFGGFVPQEFAKLYPDAKLKELKWGGFSSKYHAHILSPRSPYFKKIGSMFIKEWEKEFGKNKFYLSDSFNEMTPPVPEDNPKKKHDMMAAYGHSIYQSIKAGDPDAVWVTQGWMFGNRYAFWNPETLQAFLSKVPNDKMMILNMANEFTNWRWHVGPIWKRHNGFYGKKWVYSFINNMGGNSPWTGHLAQYASAPIKALQSPYGKNLIGFGFAPEGIEVNEVVFELLADMGWRNEKIDLDQWLAEYSQARYGGYPKQMKLAWDELQASVFGRFVSHAQYEWQKSSPKIIYRNPRKNLNVIPLPLAFLSAVKHFLACSEKLKDSKLYRDDAILLTSMYLGFRADYYYKMALLAQDKNHEKQKNVFKGKVVRILKSIDRLMVSHSNYSLHQWIHMARSWGKTPSEKNYYEQDAKRLLTRWGGRINDYAAKMWSGLIRGYYVPRVKMILSGKKNKLKNWAETWIETPGSIHKIKPYPHPITKAKELLSEFTHSNVPDKANYNCCPKSSLHE